jgi:erythromycin esterase-like protein
VRFLRLLPLLLFLGPLPLGARESAAEAARRPRPAPGYPVKPGIWRLHGTAPDLPQDDLAPLQQIVGKATVVALGESVHTSGGYYEAKHRLLRYLVEQMGFRGLAFESSWVDAEHVARYVETCDGSAGQSVSDGLFPVWYSTEVRALVQWMCDWNSAHPDPQDRLHFYGFDIQFQQKADGEALIDFLTRAGLPEEDPRIAGVRKCDGVVESFYPVLPEDRHQQCKDALAALAGLFAREAPSLIERTSREDFEWAKVRWTGLDAFEDQIYLRGPLSSEARDRGMASVFQGIRNLRQPGGKTVIWAHNFHIARNAAGYLPYATMGTFLDQSLKAAYVNVALVSHEVSIDWQGLGCGPADPPGEGAAENLFHELGEDFLLVDLDFPKGRPPFLKKGKVYELGWYPMVPRRHYDALVYLDASRKMTPLGWRSCR